VKNRGFIFVEEKEKGKSIAGPKTAWAREERMSLLQLNKKREEVTNSGHEGKKGKGEESRGRTGRRNKRKRCAKFGGSVRPIGGGGKS